MSVSVIPATNSNLYADLQSILQQASSTAGTSTTSTVGTNMLLAGRLNVLFW